MHSRRGRPQQVLPARERARTKPAANWSFAGAVALGTAIGFLCLVFRKTQSSPARIERTTSEQDRIDAYKTALDAIDRDGQALWTAYGAFLLAETVLLAFALNALFSARIGPPTWSSGPFLVSLIGTVITIPWAVTNYRSGTIRDFRVFQALDLEADPSRLLRDGKRLVEGGEATAFGRIFRLRAYARRPFTNAFWVRVLIFIWFAVDLAVVILSGPWWR
jgi:hypothetical protein